MQWVNRALDRVYAESATGPGRAAMSTPDWKAGRWALRNGENKLSDTKRDLVNRIARTNRRIGRAWTLKEQARDLYRYDHPPGVAHQLLKAWITAAKRSRIPAFVALGIGWADPATGSSFGFVHNRLVTPKVFDQASFAKLAVLLRRAVARSEINGTTAAPEFGARCSTGDSVRRDRLLMLRSDESTADSAARQVASVVNVKSPAAVPALSSGEWSVSARF